MTKKHFIKQLRSYGLNRDQIKSFITYIAKNQGKQSYDKIMEEVVTCIYKQLIKELCTQDTLITFTPFSDFIEDKFSDFRITGIDLAHYPSYTIIEPKNAIVIRSVD